MFVALQGAGREGWEARRASPMEQYCPYRVDGAQQAGRVWEALETASPRQRPTPKAASSSSPLSPPGPPSRTFLVPRPPAKLSSHLSPHCSCAPPGSSRSAHLSVHLTQPPAAGARTRCCKQRAGVAGAARAERVSQRLQVLSGEVSTPPIAARQRRQPAGRADPPPVACRLLMGAALGWPCGIGRTSRPVPCPQCTEETPATLSQNAPDPS
jgi:hypothetical protein